MKTYRRDPYKKEKNYQRIRLVNKQAIEVDPITSSSLIQKDLSFSVSTSTIK